MNGAAPLPDASATRPKRASASTIGSSHHFLLWRRNSQNSPAKLDGLRSWASCSKSLSVEVLIVASVLRRGTGLRPVQTNGQVGDLSYDVRLARSMDIHHPRRAEQIVWSARRGVARLNRVACALDRPAMNPVGSASCLLDDFGPLPVVRPASVAEVGDLVRHAFDERRAIYPLGGRTMLDVGLPPSKPGTAVDLTALADVVDYPARDM